MRRSSGSSVRHICAGTQGAPPDPTSALGLNGLTHCFICAGTKGVHRLFTSISLDNRDTGMIIALRLIEFAARVLKIAKRARKIAIRARKIAPERTGATAGADSVFWAEHNYDSSRTGYFSYAPPLYAAVPRRGLTRTHAYSRPLCAVTSTRCRKSCTRRPPLSTRSALNSGNSGNTRVVLSGTLGYSRVLSGTLGVLAALHALACGLFCTKVLTRTHGVSRRLTGYSRGTLRRCWPSCTRWRAGFSPR